MSDSVWQQELCPSPKTLFVAAKIVEAVVDHLGTTPELMGISEEMWEHQSDSLRIQLITAMADASGDKFGVIWRIPTDSQFAAAINHCSKFSGWGQELLQLIISLIREAFAALYHRNGLCQTHPEAVIGAARKLQAIAEQTQADINRAVEVGLKQQRTANFAASRKTLLTLSQQLKASKDVAALMQTGMSRRSACEELEKKYGVSYKTLERYYTKTADALPQKT